METITAPTSGICIWLAKENDTVDKGKVLAKLTAMKMEIKITATSNCKVINHCTSINQQVNKAMPVIEVQYISDNANNDTTPTTNSMQNRPTQWNNIEEQLRERRKISDRVGKNSKPTNRLTCRQRISLYATTFNEIGKIAAQIKHSVPIQTSTTDSINNTTFINQVIDHVTNKDKFVPSNFIFGTAVVGKKNVVLCVDDFAINASHSGVNAKMLARKYMLSEQVAHQLGIPLVRLLDGASGGGSVNAVLANGSTYIPIVPGFQRTLLLLNEIPVISVICGPVVGLAAVKVAASHYRVFIEKIGQVFVAGPVVVSAVGGEKLSKEELGGSNVVKQSGIVDTIVSTEQEAKQAVDRFLAFMPSSSRALAPSIAPRPPALDANNLNQLIESKDSTFSIDILLEAIVDGGTEPLEFGQFYGCECRCWLSRISGKTTAVLLAGDAHFNGGVLSIAAARKLIKFLKMCNTFRLPVVSLVDMPGIEASKQSEISNILDPSVELASALYSLTVPYATIIMRRCFGVGGGMFIDVPGAVRVAWPSADWGSLPTSGGRQAMKNSKLQQVDWQQLMSPVRTAEAFGIEDMIAPSQTPKLIRNWLALYNPETYRSLAKL